MYIVRTMRGALLLYALFLGCTSTERVSPTQILVAVTSDLTAETELSRVEIKVSKTDGSNVKSGPNFDVVNSSPEEGQVVLPIRFSVVKGEEDSFLLVVRGYGPLGESGSEEKIVEQKTIATFQEHKTLLLKIFLGRICLRQWCSADRVCYPSSIGSVDPGECGDVPEQDGDAMPEVDVDDLPNLSKPPSGVTVITGGRDGSSGNAGRGGTTSGGGGGGRGAAGSGGAGAGGTIAGAGGNGGAGSGTGGASGGGTTGGNGGAGNTGVGCNEVTPCGGALDGTWQIDATCFVGSLTDVLAASEDLPPACNDLYRSATATHTGTVTFANGLETNNFTLTMNSQIVYTSECVSAINNMTITIDANACAVLEQSLASQTGFVSATCSLVSDDCSCSASYVSQADATPQAYTLSNGRITYADTLTSPMDFCISGTTLLTQQEDTATSTIVIFTLHKLN